MFRKEKDLLKKTGLLCILCFFGIGIFAGIITSEVNVNRINIIIYPFIILAGLGIYFVYVNHKKLSYVFAPVYLILSVMFIGKYFTSYADEIKSQFFKGFIEAVQYIEDESECAFYVITPDSQFEGAYNVSEILTLFAQDIDSKYYQNKYKDENGLLYKEKYYYVNASRTEINPQLPVAYVVTEAEVGLFSEEDYIIVSFDNFYAVIPNEMAF